MAVRRFHLNVFGATLLVSAFSVSAQPLTALPSLPGALAMYVDAISDGGTVVCGDAVLLSGSARAWRWTAATGVSNLGFLSGATDSYGYGMSGDGLAVVGASGAAFDVAHRWTSATGMQSLGSLSPGQPSFASAANFDGSVVIGYGYFGSGIESGWRWTSASGMQPIGQTLPGTNQSVALSTSSDAGITVGYCYNNAPALVYPSGCLWNAAGTVTPLGTLPGRVESVPGAVSRNGAVVVGYCADGTGQAVIPFRWTAATGMQQLALPAGATQGVAGSVNSDGSLIAGYTLVGASGIQACIWVAGVPQDVATYLQGRGATTTGWVLEGVLVSADGSAFTGSGKLNGVNKNWYISFGSGCTGAPVITASPGDQTVALGASASFTLSATGASGYQWYHDTASIAGAFGSTYTIVSVAAADVGTYWCNVSNACGTSPSLPGTLALSSTECRPVFTLQPSPLALPADSQAVFTVAATSATPIDYQWRLNDNDIPGANDPSYTVEVLSAATAGIYTCQVSNDCGEVLSSPAVLSICYANCDKSAASPVLTANDFQCFLNAFASGSLYANCDSSSAVPLLTANDFQCFLNAFSVGCP